MSASASEFRDHARVTELSHSVVKHHLAGLRDRATPPAMFRQHVRVLSTLLAAAATSELPVDAVHIATPMEVTECHRLNVRIAAVPILRAGLGMVLPLQEFLPELEVWHLGVYRNEETAQPVHYYDKLPVDNPPPVAYVLDPMLASGGSAELAIDALLNWGVPQIAMLSIISAPEGIRRLVHKYPQLRLLTCAIDRELNAQKYILPGLGDAGDRIFNT